MATLTAQDVTLAGLNAVYSAADVAGDEFAWSRDTILHVDNGGASPIVVTVASQFDAQPGLAPEDLDVSIPAGETRFIGPFQQRAFADASNLVQVSYDDVTDVDVAVLKI